MFFSFSFSFSWVYFNGLSGLLVPQLCYLISYLKKLSCYFPFLKNIVFLTFGLFLLQLDQGCYFYHCRLTVQSNLNRKVFFGFGPLKIGESLEIIEKVFFSSVSVSTYDCSTTVFLRKQSAGLRKFRPLSLTLWRAPWQKWKRSALVAGAVVEVGATEFVAHDKALQKFDKPYSIQGLF